jgi:amino acid adenylation domain-containing protein
VEASEIHKAAGVMSGVATAPRINALLCFPGMFALRTRETPCALAIATGEDSLTYAELGARSDSFAAHLRSIGAVRGFVAAVHLPRSIAFVVAALGIMKAGGAYLPLDPSRPTERLAFQTADSGAQFLIASPDFDRSLQPVSARIVPLPLNGRLNESQTSQVDLLGVVTDDLAYVIYTSGSTGRPKGVEIEHRSLANLIRWHCEAFQVTPSDRASQLSSPEFDAAGWEIWPYLAAGASVHFPGDHLAKDPELLRDWLVAQEITVAFAPAPLAEKLMAMDWPVGARLKRLLTGADILHRYPSPDLPFQVFNNYGPTECTVVTTSTCLPPVPYPDLLPPIGKPIAGVRVHILDENKKPVPVGCKGEIWIAGTGLARGYRNDPEFTTEKFLPDPFSSAPGARIYSSGDLGRVLPNGQIAFLGRADNQIKIRGVRVEPAEIEASLNRHPGILQSAVVLQKFLHGDRLVAFVVTGSQNVPTLDDVRKFLSAKLPDHMIPSAFFALPRLPLTPGGKIDRAILESLDCNSSLTTAVNVPSGTAVEKHLAEILAGLLGLNEISIDDNFFMLGGHSLLGTQFIARIRDAFGVELSLRFLFEFPTIAAIASEVERLLAFRLDGLNSDNARHFVGSSRQAVPGGF